MKKLFIALAIACQVFAVHAQKDEAPFMTKSLSSETVQSVTARTQGGSMTVEGGHTSDARVEVYVHGNNGLGLSNDEIQKRLDEDYTLIVSVSGGVLTASAKPKHQNENWRHGLSIAFKIYVPQNVSTDLETSGGSIHIADLNGQEKFSTSGGSLHVDKLTGKIKGGTSGGSIEVADCSDDVDLETSGGSIHADHCSGTIRLSTSGGSLHLDNLKGVIHAGTSGGSAEGDNIEGELSINTSGSHIRLTNLSCSLDASTSGSSIDVAMNNMGKYIKLNTSGGNIDLQIPQGKGVDLDIEARKIRNIALDNFRGSQEDGRMNGTLNGGGTPITLSTSGGEVSLTTK